MKLYQLIIAILVIGVLVIGLMVGTSGCNSAVRNFGGTMTVELPAGEKLVNTTWKDDDFWYLTRPMREDEKPETYTFKEKSTFGVAEGTVIVKESTKK
jgi:hypothetical protein